MDSVCEKQALGTFYVEIIQKIIQGENKEPEQGSLLIKYLLSGRVCTIEECKKQESVQHFTNQRNISLSIHLGGAKDFCDTGVLEFQRCAPHHNLNQSWSPQAFLLPFSVSPQKKTL